MHPEAPSQSPPSPANASVRTGAPARYAPAPRTTVRHPEWIADAAIYQVNLRQFTAEGTIAAAAGHLERLRDLGVRVVWLMPVHPIGEVNRKGSLGSPYAVRDHLGVSPELGTFADLRAFVDAAHALGLKVILDWVANHTAWDNPLVTEHPEWYVRDEAGELVPTPWWDWDDIVDLDFSSPSLREYMTDALTYWVREADVDGFRCDVAGFVPIDFWETAREELERIKPVFLLAEWETRDLHVAAFDASYAWSWNSTLHHIAQGRADVTALHVFHAWHAKAYPPDSLRMTFVSNHDKNAWEGTEFEQFGDALEAAVVLSVVSDAIPLIYNGQEAGNDRRLPFFDRDPIVWREHPMGELYRSLFALKSANRALWNGHWGAAMLEVPCDDRANVLAFTRTHPQGDAVLAVVNLSPAERTVRLGRTGAATAPWAGDWTDPRSGERVSLAEVTDLPLPAWGSLVVVRGSAWAPSTSAGPDLEGVDAR